MRATSRSWCWTARTSGWWSSLRPGAATARTLPHTGRRQPPSSRARSSWALSTPPSTRGSPPSTASRASPPSSSSRVERKTRPRPKSTMAAARLTTSSTGRLKRPRMPHRRPNSTRSRRPRCSRMRVRTTSCAW
uniref:Putative secreted protein n=1 Tax=Ixodes ricinus TaxID=34613 RepID=A0A6B0USD5_IXORI